MVQHRCAELMKAGVRQLDLGFDTGDLGDPEVRERTPSRITQKCGLSQPGLAADDQRGTLTGSHTVTEAVQSSKLVVPAVELQKVAGHLVSIVL